MGIYEKVRKFFGAFGDIYFRVTTYNNLAKQHKNEFDKANALYFENQGLQVKINGLEA